MRAEKIFASAEKTRIRITAKQSREIAKMYKDLAQDISKEAEALKFRNISSAPLKIQYLNNLQRQLNEAAEDIGKAQESSIKDNMLTMAQAVVEDNQKFLYSIGLTMQGAYSYVPRDVVQEIVSGNLYKGRWSLSEAIWGQTAKTQNDIDIVIAKGIAAQKSTYEIAKDLEKYVNPAAAKPWDWGKVYPGTNRVVDYNTQRLARTMVSHAYQDSFVRTTRDNPFFDGYRWVAGNSDRTCEICEERDGQVFPKDELPLDHPNGMCTFVVEMSKSMDQVTDELAAWIKGEDNPELDNFSESLGYTNLMSISKPVNSILGLEKPTRPKKADFLNDEAYQAAREDFRRQKDIYSKEFNSTIQRIVNAPQRFKSEKEIFEWAKANKLEINPSVAQFIDLKAFNEVAPTLEALFKEFPEIRGYDYVFDGVQGRTTFRIDITNDGLLSANGGFNFNPRYFKDYTYGLETALDGMVEGWTVQGDGTFSTLVRHEFGHNVQTYIEQQIGEKYYHYDKQWSEHFTTFDEWKEADKSYWAERNKYENELISLAGLKGSSEYSNTNTMELFAEGFAEYTSGSQTEFGVEFGKFLKRWFK